MWTHLHPQSDSELTGDFISRSSRLALWRALNLRRLIAMTGSGATIPFGLPSWRDLAILFAEKTQEQIDQALDGANARFGIGDLPRRIDPLVRQLNRLGSGGGGSSLDDTKHSAPQTRITLNSEQTHRIGDLTVVMDLCETILKALPDNHDEGLSRLQIARQRFAQNFREGEKDLIAGRLRILYGLQESDAGLERDHRSEGNPYLQSCLEPTDVPIWISDENPKDDTRYSEIGLWVRALALIGGGADPAAVIRSIGQESIPEWKHHRDLGPQLPSETPGRDIVSALLNIASVSRIATLNYDVQVERAILQRLKEEKSEEAIPFWDLCKDYETKRDHEKRLMFESGIKRGAISMTLSDDNIGEIVNFGAYSRRADCQVLHLHGRFDDPENMVVTQQDYQRVYMRKSTAREIFREAQDILFGGNDVLLLGIGMSEADVLRPFRRFVAPKGRGVQQHHRIFLLRETSHDEGTWKSDNDEFALQKYQNYNVSTIFFGGRTFRRIKQIFETFETKAETILKACVSDARNETDFREATSVLNNYLRDTLGELSSIGVRAEPNGLLEDRELSILAKLRPLVLDRRLGPGKLHQRVKALQELFREFSGRVTSRALCHEIADLRKESGAWWDAWRHPPYERRAIYHLASSRFAGRSNYLWVRHCPLQHIPVPQQALADAGAETLWKPLEDAREQVLRHTLNGCPIINSKNGGRRILRIAMPRGGGKGSLVRLLMRQEYQSRLFREEKDPAQSYQGAFIAHLSFSMEFSSAATALTRFISRQLSILQVSKVPDRKAEVGRDGWLHEIWQGVHKTYLELFELIYECHNQKPSKNDSFLRYNRVLGEFSPAERTDKGFADAIWKLENFDAEDELAKEEFPSPVPDADDSVNPILWACAKALYISRRETEPRLILEPHLATENDIEPIVERPHRLDVLSSVMKAYSKRADIKSNRLFICLSGIDRICDADGDGRNPMHRALFRLLTGEAEDPDERVPNPPFDIVLISGQPDIPICFLSEELKGDQLKNLETPQEKQYFRGSKTGRVLRKWPLIGKFKWEQRVYLTPFADVLPELKPVGEGADRSDYLEDLKNEWYANIEHATVDAEKIEKEWTNASIGSEEWSRLLNLKRRAFQLKRTWQFLDWARRSDSGSRPRRITERHSTRHLHRRLWDSISLSSFVITAWAELSSDGETAAVDTDSIDEFMEQLDRAVSRDGEHGALSVILNHYYNCDRRHDPRVQVLTNTASASASDATVADLNEVLRTSALTADAELTDLILRHLSLFSLPVEPWVVMGCPVIYRRLKRLYDHLGLVGVGDVRSEGKRSSPGRMLAAEVGKDFCDAWSDANRNAHGSLAASAWEDWIERTWMLEKLRTQLDRLCARNLVIPVLASHDPAISATSSEGLTGHSSAEDFLHRRYSLHARVREHMTHKMELLVSDQADLNHHQISIYCDQPADLPTPTPKHFDMLRDLLDNQIARCRESLSAVYRHSWTGRSSRRRSWDPKESWEEVENSQSMATHDAAVRIYGPAQSDDMFRSDGLGGALGRLHAVPQRLRACYSVVRGAFSVGALSRLDGLSNEEDSEPPFEIYAGWLRGLVNAAAGLERNRRELEQTMSRVFVAADLNAFFAEGDEDVYHGNLVAEVDAFQTSDIRDHIQQIVAAAESPEQFNADEQPHPVQTLIKFWNLMGYCFARDLKKVEDSRHNKEDLRRRLEDLQGRLWDIHIAARRLLKVYRHAKDTLGFTQVQTTQHSKLRHPYYRDEIAWLYNERALTSLIQGRIYDAIPLFRQARFIMSHLREPKSDSKAFHAAERRIQLNLSIAHIERGNLDEARRLLRELEISSDSVHGSTPSKVHNYAQGYIALCDHLGGNFNRAKKIYKRVIKSSVKHRELRGVSIFSRHLADLIAREGNVTEALRHLELSINAASQAEQRDVQYLAMSSKAACFIADGQLDQAHGLITRVYGYARQMGLYRLQADIMLVQAKLFGARGENAAAAEAAAHAVTLSVNHGLRLRKLASLIEYGYLLWCRGEAVLAKSTLEDAKRQAEKLGYQTQAARASDLVSQMLHS